MSMKEVELRDELALERTRLANERTLLSYVRTALALGASGVALLHFYPAHLWLVAMAWGLIAGGGLVLAVGSVRFWAMQRRIQGRQSDR